MGARGGHGGGDFAGTMDWKSIVISRAGSGPVNDASAVRWGSMDLGTDYCYAGVPLALYFIKLF